MARIIFFTVLLLCGGSIAVSMGKEAHRFPVPDGLDPFAAQFKDHADSARASKYWYDRSRDSANQRGQDWLLIVYDLRRAVDLDPHNVAAWCLRADAQMILNQFDSALVTVDRSLSVDSSQSEIWLRRAQACNTRWRWEQRSDYADCAADAYEHVLLHNPNNERAHLELAEQYRNLGKRDEAFRVYEIMHERWPADTAAWARHADVYSGMNQPDKAEWVLDRAVEANPGDYGIRIRRFEDLCYFGSPKNAEEESRELLQQAPSRDAQDAITNALAAAHEKSGHWRDAVSEESRLIASDPSDYGAWYRRGVARRMARQPLQLQLADFDSSIARCPRDSAEMLGDPQPWCGKASVLEDMGRNGEALAILDRVIREVPEYPRGWQQKGLLLFRLEKYSDAIPNFDHAVRLDKSDTWSQVMRERAALKKQTETHRESHR